MCLNVYKFTKETLEQFKDAGADIGMVQVGNEISQGMMGIMHKTKANVWQEEEKSTIIDSYLSAGARAVRECTPDALVAIHLDNLNLGMYKDAMNAWERDNVDYDVLGASSYAFWAGKNMLENVRKAGEYVASRGKLFAVLETSWLNSQKDADGTVNMANMVCIPSSRQLKKYKIFVLPGWISGNIFMPPIVAFHEIPLVLRLQVLSVAGRLYSNLYIL